MLQDQIDAKPSPPTQPASKEENEDKKKAAAAAFISQKLNSNEDFQKFSSKNVGLDVSKDIEKNGDANGELSCEYIVITFIHVHAKEIS